MGSTIKMLLKNTLSFLLIGAAYSSRQCDTTFPDGSSCDSNAEDVTQADPANCWKYYKCHQGCVTHETCEKDYKYDDAYHWCTYPHDVDCGDRPCEDAHHCPAPTTIPTTTEDCSPPEQKINCTATGPGYWPDEFNCRKYWNCIPASEPKHLICPDDEDGNPEYFDLTYMGCNYDYLTKCNGRPVCDECNRNCEPTPTQPDDCTPDEQKIKCEELGAGWHPDEYNCRKYWHCLKEDSEPEHLTCDNDEHGEFMMWDLNFDGCNYAQYTDCGDRPTCDDCNEECWTNAHDGGETDCGHDLDCSSLKDGYYADPYSCRKYWQCSGGHGYHYMCPEEEMWDPGHDWCNWDYLVECGNRPPCNECEEGCP